ADLACSLLANRICAERTADRTTWVGPYRVLPTHRGMTGSASVSFRYAAARANGSAIAAIVSAGAFISAWTAYAVSSGVPFPNHPQEPSSSWLFFNQVKAGRQRSGADAVSAKTAWAVA